MNNSEKKNKSFYAVKNGRNVGIYTTWNECLEQVNKFSNPIYKKFSTYDEADQYLKSSIHHHNKIIETSINTSKNTSKNTQSITQIIPSIQIKYDIFDINNDYSPINRWNKYNGNIYIFTDGSNKGSVKMDNKTAGIGIYLSPETLNIKNIYYNDDIMTNNRCELFAVLYTLQIINKYLHKYIEYLLNNTEIFNTSINIVSDSSYTVNSCNEWISKWEKNDWKTANGSPVKNRDIMEEIYLYIQLNNNIIKEKLNNNLYNILTINIIHTNSHKNIDTIIDEYQKFLCQGNNIADKLAQNAI